MHDKIAGTTSSRFDSVQQTFASLWDGIEVGAALSVYWKGQPVINLWGGYTDREQQHAWQENTLVNVYSATKGLATFAFALLVEDGKVCYEDKVADYWPEFAANGKDQVTVAQLLSHQAGVCGVDESLRVEDLYNWEKMTRLIAAQKPFWRPGDASGYHAVTWGYLPGELIRRLTGQTLGQFFQERVAKPLGLNFYIGVPESRLPDCATLIGPNHARRNMVANNPSSTQTRSQTRKETSEPSKLFKASLMNPPISPFKDACSKEWRMAEIAASNGHGDATSIAKLYGLMAAGGTLNGTRLMSRETLDAACKTEIDSGIDLVTGTVIRRSRGFILSHDGNYGPGTRSFGHAGAGGSMAFADPEAELSFAYVMNQMQPDTLHESRASRLIDSVYRCL
ncbi:MAG: CubicO group peptidase (beta-lactamase class C family) [Candidatus Azotimanducaceae bacterium]